MRGILIAFFLAGCADASILSADLSPSRADLSESFDMAYVPPSSGPVSSGPPDRCRYAECQGPLDRRVELSDPVREEASK